MLIRRNDEIHYKGFPTLEEIKRDYDELINEVKDINTVLKAKQFCNKYDWFTLEINGDLLTEDTPNDLEVEWVRYEAYGCLSYIYVRTDGQIYYDVWSNDCGFDFIDSISGYLTETEYEKYVKDAKHFLETGKWS